VALNPFVSSILSLELRPRASAPPAGQGLAKAHHNAETISSKRGVSKHRSGRVDPAAQPFAIVDVETTGVFPSRDRVLEVAIIRCSPEFEIEEEYTTLVNPERDLGETSIHRITAGMLAGAPKFSEIAGDVLERLSGRAIVGHNVQFDVSLLSGEFDRLGVAIPSPARLCTMRMAYKLGPSQRKLTSCCDYFGIPLDRPHCALEDARATLSLVRKYKALADEQGLCVFADLGAYFYADDCEFPSLPLSGKVFTRSQFEANPRPSYLQRLVERLPEIGGIETAAYCCALDRVLEDRRVTIEEMEELLLLAERAALSRSAVIEAHRDYLRGLVLIALSDGVISASERDDLECVNQLLGFEDDHLDQIIHCIGSNAAPIATAEVKPELVGKKVCFTGALTSAIGGKPISRDTAMKLAGDKGLVAVDSVTKSTDILVLADPDSMSGKAKKARQYGTRLMSDRAFWILIGVQID